MSLLHGLDLPHSSAAVRIGLGITQAEFVRVTGLSISTSRRLDRGELDEPPVTYLLNCAQTLDVELEDLIEPEWRWTIDNASQAAEPPPKGWTKAKDRACAASGRCPRVGWPLYRGQ